VTDAHRTETVSVPLRERDLDHQAHVYHGVMLTLLDEGRVRFLTSLGVADAASYVVVRVELDYLAETVLSDGPLQIEFAVEHAGTTSLRTQEKVRASHGQLLATAVVTCVLWDAALRQPRALTAEERERVACFTLPSGDRVPSEMVQAMGSER
jgi:acyl-CoA thioester hydrolase